jgi:putative transposase
MGSPMPEDLKRYNGLGHFHFITFSCYRRLPLLQTAHARNIFVDALSTIRERYKFLLAGYVVMPEHVHLLISEPPHAVPSLILKVLKQRVSRDLRQVNHVTSTGGCPTRRCCEWVLGSTSLSELPRFWQPRFYDFNVHSTGKKREKLEYMHANPVNRGLVTHPKDWPWGSFSYYARGESGLIPIDPID